MAKRFSNPRTLVGVLVNFWAKASEMLCAGSVEMINTLRRCLDNWIEKNINKLILQYFC
jgi:hypothetical protein